MVVTRGSGRGRCGIVFNGDRVLGKDADVLEVSSELEHNHGTVLNATELHT